MTKRAIIFNGPPSSKPDLAATIAGSYIRKVGQEAPVVTSFMAPLQQGINTIFGLRYSPALYKERGEEYLPEFFGHAPNIVYSELLEYLQQKYKHNVLGRVAARIMKGDTVADTYIFYDLHNSDDALALTLTLGCANVLFVHLDQPAPAEYKQHMQMKDCTHRSIMSDDPEMYRLFIRAAVKAFMGYEND